MKTFHIIARLTLLVTLLMSCQNQTQEKSKNEVAAAPKQDSYKYITKANFIPGNDIGFKNEAGGTNYYYSIYVQNFDDNNGNTWDDIEHFAKTKPYTEKGLTVIFFFNNQKYTPEMTRDLEFAPVYDKYCVAGYWHYPTGKEEFKIYPFK